MYNKRCHFILTKKYKNISSKYETYTDNGRTLDIIVALYISIARGAMQYTITETELSDMEYWMFFSSILANFSKKFTQKLKTRWAKYFLYEKTIFLSFVSFSKKNYELFAFN